MTLYIMAGLLAVCVTSLAWMLHHRDKDRASRINLEDLLLGDDGRISKAAAVMLGAFALTSWQMVYMTMADKMTDALFGLYLGAWVAPTVTKLIVDGGVKKASVTTDPTTVIGTSVTVEK